MIIKQYYHAKLINRNGLIHYLSIYAIYENFSFWSMQRPSSWQDRETVWNAGQSIWVQCLKSNEQRQTMRADYYLVFQRMFKNRFKYQEWWVLGFVFEHFALVLFTLDYEKNEHAYIHLGMEGVPLHWYFQTFVTWTSTEQTQVRRLKLFKLFIQKKRKRNPSWCIRTFDFHPQSITEVFVQHLKPLALVHENQCTYSKSQCVLK